MAIAKAKKKELQTRRLWLNILAIGLPLLYVVFVVTDRLGVWDYLTGLDLVEQVANRFDQSYAVDASRPVRVGDREWSPLLSLIQSYTHASLDSSRRPLLIARFKAVASNRIPEQGVLLAEWTAPTTPLAILYEEWPGKDLQPNDYRVVGSIADLHEWISKARDARRFWVQDIFLGVFTPLLALAVVLIDRRLET